MSALIDSVNRLFSFVSCVSAYHYHSSILLIDSCPDDPHVPIQECILKDKSLLTELSSPQSVNQSVPRTPTSDRILDQSANLEHAVGVPTIRSPTMGKSIKW